MRTQYFNVSIGFTCIGFLFCFNTPVDIHVQDVVCVIVRPSYLLDPLLIIPDQSVDRLGTMAVEREKRGNQGRRKGRIKEIRELGKRK